MNNRFKSGRGMPVYFVDLNVDFLSLTPYIVMVHVECSVFGVMPLIIQTILS